MTFTFDLYQTLALSVAALTLGSFIRKKIHFFERFCIPAPVIGGLLFAVLSCVLKLTGLIEFSFDETMREVCMVFFFTCVGFQADFKLIRRGGKGLILFSLAIAILITAQNTIALCMSKLLGVSPLVCMCAASISLVGGHGTSAAFGPVLEACGLNGAMTYCIASATYGLVAGGLIGGPVGNGLIRRKNLLDRKKDEKTETPDDKTQAAEGEEGSKPSQLSMYSTAVFQLIAAVGIGTIVSWALSKTGIIFPVYVGAMITAAVIRNMAEYRGSFRVCMDEINDMSGIFLNLFLGIAMITLKLWQLAELALPLIILLVIQTLFMFFYAYVVVFHMLGHDYDAAVISAGSCGLGLGATPTAMANMQSVCRRYKESASAFLIVPVVGGVILDFMNSILITLFINLIR